MSKRRFANKIKTSGMLFLAVLMFTTTYIQPHHIYAVSQPSVLYSAHMQSYGWLNEVKDGATGGVTGEAKQMEALKIRLANTSYKGDVIYSAYVANIGWQNWKKNNQMAGTTGESRKIEALQIKLTDEMAAHYDIVYRAHVSQIGWQDWVKNGSIAGTTGQNLAIEAIEIKLVPKTPRGVTTTPENVDVITVSENDTSYTKGNNLVIFKEPDVRNFNVTTNAGNRANIYKKSRTSPVHGTYLSSFIINDYKDKKYRGIDGTGFQSEYGSIAVDIYNAQPSDTITATWDNIGLYNNRPINMKIVFRDFTYEKSVQDVGADRNLVIFEISESPFSGFLIANTPYTTAEYTFYYADTNQVVNLQGNTFLTAGSLNGPAINGGTGYNYSGEYVVHDSRDITAYLRSDTNVGIQSIPRIPSARGAIGLVDDFVDVLGDPTYTKNAAMFKVNGTTNRFIFGSDNDAIWASLSSAVLYNVTADNPTKDVLNSSRQSINNQDVKVNQELIYRIGQPVHVLGQDILDKYQSFVIKDTLPNDVTFKKAEIVDENGNVVENPGSISYNQSSREVTFTANRDFLNNYMKYNGETYYLDIHVTVADKKADSDSSNIVVSNQASSTINGVTKTSNTVKNTIRTYNVNVKHVFEKDNTVLKEYNYKKYDGESYSYSPETITYNNGANSYIPVDGAVTGSIDHQDVNIVFRYKRPAIDVNLAKVQIYTNKFRDGLPTDVYITIDTDDRAYLAGKIITLSIKDKMSNRVVVNQDLDLSTINDNRIQTTIPTNDLQKNVHRTYDVSLSTSDPDVLIHDRLITLDGYTSAEQTLTEHDADSNGKIKFEGVVMTEREFGQDMKTYDETLTVQYTPKQRVKSGYGYDLNMQVKYTNELMDQLVDKLGIHRVTGIRSGVDHRLIDNTLEFYDQHANYQNDDKVFFDLELKDESNSNTASTLNYYAPFTYLAQDTGLTYTKNQKERGEIRGKSIQAGHRFYVPIWIDELGNYVVNYKSVNDIGSHHIQFDIDSVIHVYAYMFAHADSETPDDDELLIHPIKQEDVPNELGSSE